METIRARLRVVGREPEGGPPGGANAERLFQAPASDVKRAKFGTTSMLDRFPEIRAWREGVLRKQLPLSCAACGGSTPAMAFADATDLFERGDGRDRPEPTVTIVSYPFCTSRKCMDAVTGFLDLDGREVHQRLLEAASGATTPREVKDVRFMIIMDHLPADRDAGTVKLSADLLVPPIDIGAVNNEVEDQIAEIGIIRSELFPCVGCGDRATKAAFGVAFSGETTTVHGGKVVVLPAAEIVLGARLIPYCNRSMCLEKARTTVALAQRDSKKQDRTSFGTCANCKAISMDERKELLRCSRCRVTRCCSKDCQRKDWPDHKTVCKALAEAMKKKPSNPSS
ncbi:hypothetical protein DFJ74DRAFT_664389 [Hyaloraphidium curvatum]|nr:hypothetical protein DFJ74DRAFT_664389 [Hyaloraphidium curvatum]